MEKNTVLNDGVFTGERALYMVHDLEINNSSIMDGESPLKHALNVKIKDSTFQWKYPVWHSEHIKMEGGAICDGGRAGIWYTNDISLKNVLVEAPKEFRRCDGVLLENVTFTDAQETLWNCKNVILKNVQAKGPYFAMNTENLTIENLSLSGNYPFDGCKNVVVKNSKLLSKDAFWNCENVTVYDSYILGEYFAWNSKNVTLVNCVIDSNQGLCYIENLVMKNCRLGQTDLAFEYSTVDAEIKGKIRSIKNPKGGKIIADEIEELLLDETKIDPAKTNIICPKINKKTLGITDPVKL